MSTTHDIFITTMTFTCVNSPARVHGERLTLQGFAAEAFSLLLLKGERPREYMYMMIITMGIYYTGVIDYTGVIVGIHSSTLRYAPVCQSGSANPDATSQKIPPSSSDLQAFLHPDPQGPARYKIVFGMHAPEKSAGNTAKVIRSCSIWRLRINSSQTFIVVI